MGQITIEVPDEISTQLLQLGDQLPDCCVNESSECLNPMDDSFLRDNYQFI